VNVDSRAHAVVIIAKTQQGWVPIEVGNQAVASKIASAVTKWQTASPHSLVYVPSLHLYLLKSTSPSGPARFAPVQDLGNFKQGVEVPTDALFQNLNNRLPVGAPDSGDLNKRAPF
jgi:hypothetical protein